MALNKAGVAAIVAASTVAAVAVGNQIIGGIVLDTPCTINAEVVAAKFKYFQHKNKDKAIDKAVADFFKAPRGAKLIATPTETKEGDATVITWKYELVSKNDWKATADKKAEKKAWKDAKVLQDWEAVNQYLKDQTATTEETGK